jgi:hypothetical protein
MVACGDGEEADTGSINNANQGGAGQAGAAGQPGAGAAGAGQGGQAGADPGKVCTPGLTQVCLGPGACKGAQSCLPSGEQWGPCDCGSGQAGAAGAGQGGESGASGQSGAGQGGESGGAGQAGVAGAAGQGGDSGQGGNAAGQGGDSGQGGNAAGQGGTGEGGAGQGGSGGDAGSGGGEGGAGQGGAGQGGAGQGGSNEAGQGGAGQGGAGAGGSGQGGAGSGGVGGGWTLGGEMVDEPNDGVPANATVMSLARDNQGNLLAGVFVSGGKFSFQGQTLEAAGKFALVVMKLDGAGKLLWMQSAKADGMGVPELGVDAAGNVVVIFGFMGKLEITGGLSISSAGALDGVVAKLSPSGELLWAQPWGSDQHDLGYSVSVAPEGSIYVSGFYNKSLSFGGKFLMPSGAPFEGFLAKLDAQGNAVWLKGMGSGTLFGAHGFKVREAPSGDLWVAGGASGSLSVAGGPVLSLSSGGKIPFVARVSGNGDHLSSKAFPMQFAGSGYVAALQVDAAGGLWMGVQASTGLDLGGGMLSVQTSSTSSFLGAFDSGGAHRWSKVLSATGQGQTQVVLEGLALTPEGGVALAGFFSGKLDAGGGELASPISFGSHENAGLFAEYSADGAHKKSSLYEKVFLMSATTAQDGLPVLGGTYLGPDGPFAGQQGIFLQKIAP